MSITLGKVIELVDEIKPNDFSNDAKTAWLNECEGMVQTEVWLIAIEEVITYSYEENKDTALLVEAPHSKIYEAYLTARIDYANGEYKKYQNTMQMFNHWYREYMRWYATRYRPADKGEDPWKGHYFTAYGIAVKHGFQGSEEDWLYEPKAAADAAYQKALEALNNGEEAVRKAEDAATAAAGSAEAAKGSEAAAAGSALEAAYSRDGAARAEDEAKNAAQQAAASEDAAKAAQEAAEATAGKVEDVAKGMENADYLNRLDALEKRVEDLHYKAIDITSCTVTPGVAELGSSVDMVVVSWALNKTPAEQTVAGEDVGTTVRNKRFVDLALTEDTSFEVSVTDERGAVDAATGWIRFYNGVYYGALDADGVINSAAILSLTRALQAGKGKTFSVTAGEGQKFAYALPSRYGIPAFNVGGFDYVWTKAATFDFTNASGYTEEYDVWLNDEIVVGTRTVKVT